MLDGVSNLLDSIERDLETNTTVSYSQSILLFSVTQSNRYKTTKINHIIDLR